MSNKTGVFPEKYALRCRSCTEEKPDHVCMSEWSRIDIHLVDTVMYISCSRHRVALARLDLDGYERRDFDRDTWEVLQ